jgi:hypothetical protein
MNNKPQSDQLDVVLDNFLASTSADDPRQLAEWVRTYPQYGRELTELALSRLRLELHSRASPEPVEDPALVERGMEIVRRMLRPPPDAPAPDAAHAGAAPIRDLLAEAKARGIDARGLARTLRLSLPMVARLNRGLIWFGSIPERLVQDLAGALGRDLTAVAAFLQGGPRLQAGNQYKSETPPEVEEAEGFADAIRADPVLSDDDKDFWVKQTER